MKCQVCDRDHGTLLSICPACGAMMNDTVREELAPKVTPSGNLRPAILPPPPVNAVAPTKNPYRVPPPAMASTHTPSVVLAPLPKPLKAVTAPLRNPKTSQTLVEFQTKSAPVPEWRLQMQNAVRARQGSGAQASAVATAPAPVTTTVSSAPEANLDIASLDELMDPRLGSALKRIAESRASFAAAPAKPAEQRTAARPATSAPPKNFPFDVVERNADAPVKNSELRSSATTLPKPTLVAPIKLDTSRLPKIEAPLSPVEESQEVDKSEPMIIKSTGDLDNRKRIFIAAEKPLDELVEQETDDDEIEDLAPIGLRFNAGFFDLIMCTVATMVLLSPFAFSNREWFSLSSLLVFAGVLGLTTFVYCTLTVGFYGRTFGMKIFSLEVVDAEENEYPTLAQAAASSGLYLASLLFLGVGFVAVLFNEERRALHDLLSGTIVVRQF